MNNLRIKKGDTIRVITGKDKGKTGKIIKVSPRDNKVIVEGINVYKKHVRPRTQQEKGQTVLVPRPIHASNVENIEKKNSSKK
jgi:large subunit ribosomal protein L24